jgi:hypothetical protein
VSFTPNGNELAFFRLEDSSGSLSVARVVYLPNYFRDHSCSIDSNTIAHTYYSDFYAAFKQCTSPFTNFVINMYIYSNTATSVNSFTSFSTSIVDSWSAISVSYIETN